MDHADARIGGRHRQSPRSPLADLHLPWSVGLRTGDTSANERARQGRRLPTTLITTPESLTLILARADAHAAVSTLRMVVVDEWHELLGNKRGVQLQLALARLRRWHPELIVWGVSATLGNQAHAEQVLIPQGNGISVRGPMARRCGSTRCYPRPSNASRGPGISA